MADVTTFTRSGSADWFEKCESDPAAVADSIILDEPVSDGLTHCFVGVQQFDSGGLPDVGSGGSYAISVKLVCSEVWEDVGSIDADDPRTLNFVGNVSAIRAVPDSIAGDPVTYKLVLMGNRR